MALKNVSVSTKLRGKKGSEFAQYEAIAYNPFYLIVFSHNDRIMQFWKKSAQEIIKITNAKGFLLKLFSVFNDLYNVKHPFEEKYVKWAEENIDNQKDELSDADFKLRVDNLLNSIIKEFSTYYKSLYESFKIDNEVKRIWNRLCNDVFRIEPELLTTKLILDFILLKCNSDILGQEDFEHVVKLSKEVDRKIEMLQKSFVAKNRKGLIVFI